MQSILCDNFDKFRKHKEADANFNLKLHGIYSALP